MNEILLFGVGVTVVLFALILLDIIYIKYFIYSSNNPPKTVTRIEVSLSVIDGTPMYTPQFKSLYKWHNMGECSIENGKFKDYSTTLETAKRRIDYFYRCEDMLTLPDKYIHYPEDYKV